MNCTNCGTQLTGSEFTCPACGAPVQQGYQYQQNNQFPQNNAQGMNYAGDRSAGNYDPNLSFGGAVKLYFKNYVNFSGRASKREYWWSVLFAFLLSFTGIGGLVCFIGGLSIGIRRLHDIGKSGASILLCLIPFAGPIIMLVLYLRDSDPNPNQYGGGPALFASNFSPNARPDGAPSISRLRITAHRSIRRVSLISRHRSIRRVSLISRLRSTRRDRSPRISRSSPISSKNVFLLIPDRSDPFIGIPSEKSPAEYFF